MKHILILLLALPGLASGQVVGDYTFTRKAAVGNTPVILTPVPGNVIVWDGSGVATNLDIAGTYVPQSRTVNGSPLSSNITITTISGLAGTATALATGRTLAITGDLTWTSPTFDGTGNVTAAGTLATVNSNVGSFGSATAVASFTANAKGLITAASNVTITPAVGSITGLGAGVATWLATASSANLATALTDENGSGKIILSAGTLAVASGKTLTASNTITLAGSDGTTITLPTTSATMARTDAAQAFVGNQTFDTTTLYVDATNDRVGVGLIAPETALQAYGVGTTYPTSAAGIFSVATPQKSGLYKSRMFFGIDNITNASAGQGYIQARDIQQNNNINLLLNPNGGGVAIGCSLADQALSVGQNGNAFLKVSNSSGYGGGGGATPYAGLIFQVATADSSVYEKGGVTFKTTETGAGYARGELRFLLNPTASNANVQDTVDTSTVMMCDWKNMNVGIGTLTPNAGAILDVTSTTRAFLPPRMTKTQRDAIASPTAGMVIYQTDNTPGLRVRNGSNWMRYTETAD